MQGEFSVAQVTRDVLAHLERRRPAIVDDPEAVEREVTAALDPVRRAYQELDLEGPDYLEALGREVQGALPARWRQLAGPFTRLERDGFGLWRGGDPIARTVYVVLGFLLGLFILRLPFIPIWEKWVPFALALAAWWLPDLQVRFHRRRYARDLDRLIADMDSAQPEIDRHVALKDLLPPG